MSGIPLAFTFPFVLAALVACRFCILLRITPHAQHLCRSAAATHSGASPRMRPRRTRPGGCSFASEHRGLPHSRDGGTRFEPAVRGTQTGPLLIVLDNGWPAAPGWERRIAAAARRIETAKQSSQLAAIVATSEAARDIVPIEAAKAQDRLRALKPAPFIPDRLPF